MPTHTTGLYWSAGAAMAIHSRLGLEQQNSASLSAETGVSGSRPRQDPLPVLQGTASSHVALPPAVRGAGVGEKGNVPLVSLHDPLRWQGFASELVGGGAIYLKQITTNLVALNNTHPPTLEHPSLEPRSQQGCGPSGS